MQDHQAKYHSTKVNNDCVSIDNGALSVLMHCDYFLFSCALQRKKMPYSMV